MENVANALIKKPSPCQCTVYNNLTRMFIMRNNITLNPIRTKKMQTVYSNILLFLIFVNTNNHLINKKYTVDTSRSSNYSSGFRLGMRGLPHHSPLVAYYWFTSPHTNVSAIYAYSAMYFMSDYFFNILRAGEQS